MIRVLFLSVCLKELLHREHTNLCLKNFVLLYCKITTGQSCLRAAYYCNQEYGWHGRNIIPVWPSLAELLHYPLATVSLVLSSVIDMATPLALLPHKTACFALLSQLAHSKLQLRRFHERPTLAICFLLKMDQRRFTCQVCS